MKGVTISRELWDKIALSIEITTYGYLTRADGLDNIELTDAEFDEIQALGVKP